MTIALDGENFKDFYAENATPFLDALYSGLVASTELQSVHIGAFLDRDTEAPGPLPTLWTGSWVDANLRTWVGDEAHTRAWTLLAMTRDTLLRVDAPSAHPRAWDELLIAESSDWFWWFGEHHDSGFDASWDELFRTHLRNAHTLAGLDVPPALDQPVIAATAIGHDCAPLRSIDPASRGPAEWRSAGIAEVGAVYGAMRPPASSVTRILYGAGGGRLHLRFGEGTPRFDRVVIDAGPVGTLVVERAARSLSVATPTVGPLDFAITLDEAGRGSERVPLHGALHVSNPAGAVDSRRRVLIVAAECAPLASAGDLAGAVAATAADAAELGHEVVVVIPHHREGAFGSSAGVRIDRLTASAWGAPLEARVVQGALESRIAHPQRRCPCLVRSRCHLWRRGRRRALPRLLHARGRAHRRDGLRARTSCTASSGRQRPCWRRLPGCPRRRQPSSASATGRPATWSTPPPSPAPASTGPARGPSTSSTSAAGSPRPWSRGRAGRRWRRPMTPR